MAPGDVSIARLRALLAEQTEHETLDYKEEFHPDDPRAWVELAKDVGAMQIDGGYLVFGADNNGVASCKLTKTVADRLDESAVRGRLRKWIPEPFEIRTARHTVDANILVLMSIAPNGEGFCVFKEDGAFLRMKGGKEEFAFRKGDVFARHGSASERWQQPDIDRIKRNLKRRSDEADRVRVMTSVTPLCRLLIDEPIAMLAVAGFGVEPPLTQERVKEICGAMTASNPPPLILSAASYANWWGYFGYWCRRSLRNAADAMTLSSFLDPELASLLHRIQGSVLFKQFDSGFVPADPMNVWWLADPLWNHLELTRELLAYLARSAGTGEETG